VPIPIKTIAFPHEIVVGKLLFSVRPTLPLHHHMQAFRKQKHAPRDSMPSLRPRFSFLQAGLTEGIMQLIAKADEIQTDDSDTHAARKALIDRAHWWMLYPDYVKMAALAQLQAEKPQYYREAARQKTSQSSSAGSMKSTLKVNG
jgi:hypothetical protein